MKRELMWMLNAGRQFVVGKYLDWLERESRKQFTVIRDRTEAIGQKDILACSVLHNEKKRLPFFLEYYRKLGVRHFLLIDHESEDGTSDYLAEQEDCSCWRVGGIYPPSRAGTVWSNRILNRYAHGHWALRLDPDEFFVYPYCDARNIQDLTGYLDSIGRRSFYALLVDCYAETSGHDYAMGDNMFEQYPFFDGYGYMFPGRTAKGGFRYRLLYSDSQNVPILNKFPLVRWKRGMHYLSSTHKILPDVLNKAHGDKNVCPTGCLMHFKIAGNIKERAAMEIKKRQRFGGAVEYHAIADMREEYRYHVEGLSVRYTGWESLERCGLLTVGNWR
jgi:hypothetical protein